MSTRSRIGIQLSDESVLSVYHHSDGYPSWLGRILSTHYNTKELAAELIDGGDMSSCWTDQRWNYDGSSVKVEGYGPQYYVRKSDGDCPPRLDSNKYDYLAEGEEYAYLYTLNGEWVCYDMHQFEENTMPTVAEIPSGALAV
jgi:hypothetical protein